MPPNAFSPHVNHRIHAVIQRALNAQRLVGAVVLVMRNGEWIHQQAAGWADRENARPMALDTIFRLASVSKPITSLAALILVAQGRVGLDDDVRYHLPEFETKLPDGTPACITLRHLLSHTAGLGYRFFEADAHGAYAQAGVSDGMDASEHSLEENLQRIARVPLLYTPGSAWAYSLATDVVGALVAHVCGTSLGEAVRTLVTGPLEMADTDFIAVDPQRMAVPYVSDKPQPHRLSEGEMVSPFEGAVGITYSPARILNRHAFHSAGASMAGTALDFMHFLETLRRGATPWLPSALLEEMARDQTQGAQLPCAPGFGFGLGFSVLRDPILAASPESPGTWRWGGAYGHSWFVDRTQALSVVAFTNTLYEGMSGPFVTELRDAIYGVQELS
ncbi:beta-lactamase family protein [Lampropedia puyangensis]|uniref:Beta-lactamase family protein n=1 Tax=Lampropedia puyangensis TaxID=1330072 RepID=A0A4V4GR91_9BURK|nr:beta-lactamase family protein [Lampropedia puyangensis]